MARRKDPEGLFEEKNARRSRPQGHAAGARPHLEGVSRGYDPPFKASAPKERRERQGKQPPTTFNLYVGNSQQAWRPLLGKSWKRPCAGYKVAPVAGGVPRQGAQSGVNAPVGRGGYGTLQDAHPENTKTNTSRPRSGNMQSCER